MPVHIEPLSSLIVARGFEFYCGDNYSEAGGVRGTSVRRPKTSSIGTSRQRHPMRVGDRHHPAITPTSPRHHRAPDPGRQGMPHSRWVKIQPAQTFLEVFIAGPACPLACVRGIHLQQLQPMGWRSRAYPAFFSSARIKPRLSAPISARPGAARVRTAISPHAGQAIGASRCATRRTRSKPPHRPQS